MCVFMCLGGNSTTWMNTAVLVTSIRNFRKNRGPVSGILKGFVGLSTGIFTYLCSALFSDDPSSFLVMLSLIPFAVCLTGIFFLRETPPASTAAEHEEESNYFTILNALAVVVAVYLLIVGFLPDPNIVISRILAGGLLVLLASPLVIPVHSYSRGLPSEDIEGSGRERLLGSEGKAREAAEEAVVAGKRGPAVGEEHTIMEALVTVEFWILFVSFLCGVGTGLAVMNNMGQIGVALGYADVSLFVSLTSIWGFFGRIISGSVSEYFIK